MKNKSYSWRGSSELHGSPATAGSGPIGVVINEIIARTETPIELSDSIELFNSSETDIDIGGWFLSDDRRRDARRGCHAFRKAEACFEMATRLFKDHRAGATRRDR